MPPLSTITKAAKNNQLRTFPGLTSDLLTKHLPLSTATAKGHVVRLRQGINSTRNDRQATIDARLQVDDMNPAEEMCTAINNEVFYFTALTDTTKGTIYSDSTGRFPLQSYAGMQYIFIAYICDQNYIIIRPMKNRSDASMTKVFKDVYRILQQKGTNPSLHVLDNECSKAIKTFVADQQTVIQLVEPHNHRVNTAEVSVKTAKYHFISALATVAT